MKIQFLNQFIRYFQVFHKDAGAKLYLLCLIIFAGGSLEGIGLSFLLPILNFEADLAESNAYSQFVYQLIEKLGLSVTLGTLLGFMCGIFLLKGFFMFLQAVFTSAVTTSLVRNRRLKLTKEYAAMRYDYYTDSSIGYLNNIITTEVDRAFAALAKFTDVLTVGAYVIVYSVAALLMNVRLSLLVFAICFVLFILLRRLAELSRELSIRVSGKNAEIQSLLIQIIYNFKYLKATASFLPLFKQLKKRIEDYRIFQFRNAVISNLPGSLVEPCAVLFLSGLIFFHASIMGRPINEILILLLFFYKAFSRIFGLQVVWQKFCAKIGGVEAVQNISRDLATHKEATGDFLIEDFQDSIQLSRVRFSYEKGPTLSDINMVIPKNKTVGIVGESGAGKTTLFDIITALLKPDSGDIYIDGVNYRQVDLQSLRKMIGYVTQEPVIFNDSIANNISFWRGDPGLAADLARVEKASRQAHCLEFVQRASDRFETVIGDKGVKLSMGQRQRIAIARELYKQPQILIFDEATSALDTDSELLIQKSIQEMSGTMTMIIVAHRLSTIKDCDYIYVVSEGRILEEGSFADLNASETSRFREMCQLQNI